MSEQLIQQDPSGAQPDHPPTRPGRRRATVAVAGIAVVAVAVAGAVLAGRLGADDPAPSPGARPPPRPPPRPAPRPAPRAGDPTGAPAGDPTGAPASDPVPGSASAEGPVEVSGDGVGAVPFGTDADQAMTALTASLGEPDRTTGPDRFSRIPGHDGWYEVADDPISPSWRYELVSTACWGTLCVTFGGNDPDALLLRGWSASTYGDGSGGTPAPARPDVRLAGTTVGLGTGWEDLHAAYPGATVQGAEGGSLAVGNTPWPAVFDGAGGWRLSGQWDYEHPHRAPADAVVTRLSGGEGPEPGCC